MSYAAHLSADGFAILLFHGVVATHRHRVRNYTRKHLDVARFTAVLDELTAAGTCVALPDVVAARAAGRPLPPRAFVLTFDDGFENNATVAAPLLRERGLPATFYVTTAFVEVGLGSWTDTIEYAVETVEAVRLALPGVDRARTYRTVAEKVELLDGIRAHVKGCRDLDPYDYASEVRRQLGVTAMEPDPELDAKMSWTQVRELDGDPLFTVGGHGHTHRILAYLADDDLDDEIDISLDILAARLGHPVAHYSYPEGLATCYSDNVIRRLRARSIVCAPSAEPGLNRLVDDPFRFTRIQVV